MKKRTLAWVGLIAVVIHALSNIAHGVAHFDLRIQLAGWQMTFIALAMGAAPLVAAILLWTSRFLLAARMLAVSMAASLLFGMYYHYIAVSPDHVAHLPAGDEQGLFRFTALLLVISQALGVAVGIWGSLRHDKVS